VFKLWVPCKAFWTALYSAWILQPMQYGKNGEPSPSFPFLPKPLETLDIVSTTGQLGWSFRSIPPQMSQKVILRCTSPISLAYPQTGRLFHQDFDIVFYIIVNFWHAQIKRSFTSYQLSYSLLQVMYNSYFEKIHSLIFFRWFSLLGVIKCQPVRSRTCLQESVPLYEVAHTQDFWGPRLVLQPFF
jgi:hypothetical protein